MISPITGEEMKLTKERRAMNFRKETFEIYFHYFKCEKSGEQFTTTELDDLNLNQLQNQYRDKFNIPFPDEIIRIRKKYGLSASKMSEILGLGINSYRQYESGEIPSVSNGKLIQIVDDPKKFVEMVELCPTLDFKTKNKYIQKAQILIQEKKQNIFFSNLTGYFLGNHLADIYSGYRNPSLEKFTEMVVYFSEHLSPYKTKLNKLLFYADFSMFKEIGYSISGTRYVAIELGPVPNNFQSIFEYLSNQKEINIISTEFPNGSIGEQFKLAKDRKFNPNLFSENELQTLEKVAYVFKKTSTNDIINFSHLEKAWINNEKEKNTISYEYAFDLNPL